MAIIAAGLPSLPPAVTEAATFGERSRFVELGLLREVAVAEALRVPAEHHGATRTNEVIEAAIAAELGLPTTSLSRPRQQLIDRGYIEAVGHGKLRFTIPGFAAYIRDNF